MNVFTSIKSKLFSKNKEQKVSVKTSKGGARQFLSKLSGAFLLPISILAIAGLFLGVGSTIASNCPEGSAGEVFGNFIKQLGDPLFGALPLLFAAAIAVSFTEEAGVAVFNAIVGYLIFSALQTVFITPVKDAENAIIGYKILFGGGWRTPQDLQALVGSTLGFNVMQTSVFGGIIVGFIVQWAYNRFHTIQLPQVISFFGGKRFVAIVVIVLMIPLVFIFLIFWPYIGYVFNWIGRNSGRIPYGFDSFIFGFIERSLVPFGLHHVFYSPLWYTSAGGDVSSELANWLKNQNNQILLSDLQKIMNGLKAEVDFSSITTSTGYVSWADVSPLWKSGSVMGDSTTSLAMIGVNVNNVHYMVNNVVHSKPLFMFIQDELGLKLGRFLDGKFSFMQWGLPFAGLAMIMAAPKENRKVAMGVIFPASLTCFVTGVTEPLEFTFLFLAPALFFGFHALMCAVSFLMANILSVHIGMAFSGGFLDLVVYGIVPVMKGTNFWWTIVVGMAYIPIYYFVFFFWIKKADLPTPGRGGNTKLFTKKDYQARKDSQQLETNIDPQALNVIQAFGGRENIVKTANCATRLRFDVKSSANVNEQELKNAGAFGLVKVSDTHVQAIFGPVADQLRVKIDDAIRELDKNPNVLNFEQNKEVENKTQEQIESEIKKQDISLTSPVKGNVNVKSLASLNDGTFSQKLLGEGFVVEQTDGKVYSPVEGKIVTLFPTKHAFGFETKEGLKALVHIGIDTVNLEGKGFELAEGIKQDKHVRAGQLLVDVDLDLLKQNNIISDIIVVVTPDSKIQPAEFRIQKNQL